MFSESEVLLGLLPGVKSRNPRRMKKFVLLAIALVVGVSIQAQVITKWTFESTVPTNAGPFSAEIGAGFASGLHAGAAVYSSPSGNGSTHSYSANTWAIGDYWQFQTSN